MTTREMLTLAAKAMGLEFHGDNETCSGGRWIKQSETPGVIPTNRRAWNPLTNSGDCAELCAALGINTNWVLETDGTPVRVVCESRKIGRMDSAGIVDNDRAAAWRLAAVRVAAAIGEVM